MNYAVFSHQELHYIILKELQLNINLMFESNVHVCVCIQLMMANISNIPANYFPYNNNL